MRDAYHVDDIESLDIILKNTQLASAQRGKSHISVYVKESGSELRRVPDVRDIRFERRNPIPLLLAFLKLSAELQYFLRNVFK